MVPEDDPEQGYEPAGCVWFLGFNDLISDWTYDKGSQPRGYDLHGHPLAQFIRDARKDLPTPKLPFVIGVMGIGGVAEDTKPDGQRYFRQAQVAAAAKFTPRWCVTDRSPGARLLHPDLPNPVLAKDFPRPQ